MNEEIDIIELLKRVKEGKAPKIIQFNRRTHTFVDNEKQIAYLYKDINNDYWEYELGVVDFNTKIKILDKPIIEELEPNKCYFKDGTELVYKEMYSKINEIIKWINNKE